MELAAIGWEAMLELGMSEQAVVTAKDLPTCEHCASQQGRTCRRRWAPPVTGAMFYSAAACEEALARLDRVKAGVSSSPQLQSSPLLHAEWKTRHTRQDVVNWLGEQGHRFAEWITLVEVWTGKGRLSDCVNELGGNAIKIGLTRGHDLGRLRDRELLIVPL